VTDREKLKREILLLGQTIQANASALASKVMSDEDRQSLQRQMAVRVAHQNLLQRRLDRLSPAPDDRIASALKSNLSTASALSLRGVAAGINSPASGSSRPVPSPVLRAGFSIGEQPMSRVPWHLFQDRQAQAHLVVGALVAVAESEHEDELAVAQYVLKRLVSNQKPTGDYAATVARDGGRPEVYFAFDDEADARKFAAVLEAKTTAKHPGWASHRAFDLDSAKLRALEASLPSRRRDKGKTHPPAKNAKDKPRGGDLLAVLAGTKTGGCR
jgi:hypothetical protein